MITKVYTADIKLNKTDSKYVKYIYLENEHGVLLINKGLFGISFQNKEHMDYQEIEIKNKTYVCDIDL